MSDDIYNLFDTLPASFIPENRPKAGTIYLYVWDEDAKKDDWRVDGYRWRQNGFLKNSKCGSGIVNKIYFKVYDGPNSQSNKFTRTVYTREDKPKSVVVQYFGDEAVAGFFPHGNSSKNSRAYVRTQPHVLRDIESTTSLTATRLYHSMVSAGAAEVNQSTAVPRNVEQVRNVLKAQRNRHRLSHDALFNLHELAHDLDFIKHITTFPDLSVFLYHQTIIETFKSSLSMKLPPDQPTQQMTYDTTFNLGDFYLSILLFRATEFESQPVIPLAYLIHERKLQTTHEAFFDHLVKIIPEMNTATNLVLITDQERAIIQSVQKYIPNLKTFLCWNHVLQDCKRWLRVHGVSKADEMSFYLDNIRDLMQSTSLENYKDSLLSSMLKWSQPFSQYFMSNIHPSMSHLGLWELDRYHLDQATTNQSESFNYVLKRLQEWKEAPVDAMSLTLFRLTEFHINEIKRGESGMGNYVLREGLASCPWIPSSVAVTEPEQIVEIIRNSVTVDSSQPLVAEPSQPVVDGESSHSVGASQSSQSSGPVESSQSSGPVESSQSSGPAESSHSQSSQTFFDPVDSSTMNERAARVIASNQIALNPQLSVFTVNGTIEPRVVRLFPTISCSCPSKTRCYHIAAARLAIGIREDMTRRQLNLTQLRKNNRKKQDKTAGRKRPRIDDIDVVPAGDADDTITGTLQAVIQQDTENRPVRPDEVIQEVEVAEEEIVIREDICYRCDEEFPPPRKNQRIQPKVNWIGCDKCRRWFHNVCIGKTGKNKKYLCDFCI